MVKALKIAGLCLIGPAAGAGIACMAIGVWVVVRLVAEYGLWP